MNRKSVMVLFATVLISMASFAQKQFYAGASAGIIVPSIINQNNYGLQELDYVVTTKMDWQVFAGYDFSKHLGLKVEFGSATLGQDYDNHEDASNDTVKRKIDLSYMQIPLLLKFRTGGETIRFFAAAGPQFDFLNSAKQEYTSKGAAFHKQLNNNANQPFDAGQEDIKDRYNSMDIMIRLDFGAEFTVLKNLVVSGGITSAYGFTDINATDYQMKDNKGTYNASQNVYGGFNVGLCYTFGGK